MPKQINFTLPFVVMNMVLLILHIPAQAKRGHLAMRNKPMEKSGALWGLYRANRDWGMSYPAGPGKDPYVVF